MNDHLTIYKNFTFEASHVLPKHEGQCARLHGHSWKLTVGISGPVDPETGFVVDYAKLSSLVKAHIIDNVDHHHLGAGNLGLGMGTEVLNVIHYRAVFGTDFYPSSENLVKCFVRILQPLVQELGLPEYILRKDNMMTPSAGKTLNEGDVTIPASILLEEVSLDETCTCRATWRRDA